MRVEKFKNPEYRKLLRNLAACFSIIIALTVVCISQKIYWGIIGVIIAGFITQFFCIYVFSNSIYGKIHMLIFSAEKIMRGKYDVTAYEDGEGELAILGFQFNQLSKRLKHTLEQLEEEKEALKRWISDLSHQLKTPLSVIQMYSEIMAQQIEKEEDVDKAFIMEMLTKNLDQLEGMEKLIQEVLKVSRLQSGMIKMNKKDEDIKQTVLMALEEVRLRAQMKNTKILVNIPDNEIVYLHDSLWIKEALKNIIKNAVDYSGQNGEVSISIIVNESIIKIVVKDNGPGISKEDLPHLFERFYRGKSQRKIAGGTGIGLALAKLIIELHEGLISVESREGEDTVVSSTFGRY